jgi:hypothetical protein
LTTTLQTVHQHWHELPQICYKIQHGVSCTANHGLTAANVRARRSPPIEGITTAAGGSQSGGFPPAAGIMIRRACRSDCRRAEATCHDSPAFRIWSPCSSWRSWIQAWVPALPRPYPDFWARQVAPRPSAAANRRETTSLSEPSDIPKRRRPSEVRDPIGCPGLGPGTVELDSVNKVIG